jgi:hypothetical protein
MYVAADAVERVIAAGNHRDQVRESGIAQSNELPVNRYRGLIVVVMLYGRKSHRNLRSFRLGQTTQNDRLSYWTLYHLSLTP